MKSYFFRNKYFYIVYEILKQNHKITNVYVYCVCIQVCMDGFRLSLNIEINNDINFCKNRGKKSDFFVFFFFFKKWKNPSTQFL